MKEEYKKLKDFDVEIKTYITLEEQANICSLMMESDNYFERKLHLVMGVFCTVVKDADESLTYDDIVSCGLWEAIAFELAPYIQDIEDAVRYYNSIEYTLTKGLDLLTKSLDEVSENMPSIDKIIETLEQAQDKLETEKTNG